MEVDNCNDGNFPSIYSSIHRYIYPSSLPWIYTCILQLMLKLKISKNERSYAELLRNLKLFASDYKFEVSYNQWCLYNDVCTYWGYVTRYRNIEHEKPGFWKVERSKLIRRQHIPSNWNWQDFTELYHLRMNINTCELICTYMCKNKLKLPCCWY